MPLRSVIVSAWPKALTVSTSFEELLLAPVEGSGEEKGTFYFPFHGAIYLLKVECPEWHEVKP